MKKLNFLTKRLIEAIIFLVLFFAIFGYLAHEMSMNNMLNTIMNTAHDLLLNTVLYIMGITVLTGALGKLLTEFGVVRLIEVILRPLMKPLYNLPGVAALGAVLTFLSDNPAIISLSKEKNFSQYFKKYQIVSLTNFGTAFGMGLVVIAFMAGKGFGTGAVIGLIGSFAGSIVTTRFMQYFTLKHNPEMREEVSVEGNEQEISFKSEGGAFLRGLNAILDGGKSGVEIGLAIILTFGPSADGTYTGGAYEGVALLPYLAGKINFVFEWLFGFTNPELVAFPITSLGAVGAALGLIPRFIQEGLIDNNAIAVFTAMGMCWSGFLSTHTAMLDSMGYRKLTSKAILSHFVGGLVAGIVAHWAYVAIAAIMGL